MIVDFVIHEFASMCINIYAEVGRFGELLVVCVKFFSGYHDEIRVEILDLHSTILTLEHQFINLGALVADLRGFLEVTLDDFPAHCV